MRKKEAAMFAQLPLITRELDWTTQTFQALVFFFLLFFSLMQSNPHVLIEVLITVITETSNNSPDSSKHRAR